MTLDQLALQTSTDRSSRFHDYMRTYEEWLAPVRGQKVRLLEMGILGGDGLVTWDNYFTHEQTEIIGIDIHSYGVLPTMSGRVNVRYGSQGDSRFLESLPRPFNIVIDDAGHFTSQQVCAFEHLWPWVAPNGMYVIEDLHTYGSPCHQDYTLNIMQWLARIAIEMQSVGAAASGRVEPADKWRDIDTITIRKGLAMIRKHP